MSDSGNNLSDSISSLRSMTEKLGDMKLFNNEQLQAFNNLNIKPIVMPQLPIIKSPVVETNKLLKDLILEQSDTEKKQAEYQSENIKLMQAMVDRMIEDSIANKQADIKNNKIIKWTFLIASLTLVVAILAFIGFENVINGFIWLFNYIVRLL